MQYEHLTIAEFELLCPGTSRRSLQRDLKLLLEKGLMRDAGTGSTDPNRRYIRGEP